jgi:predicted Zn-dependent peptidase
MLEVFQLLHLLFTSKIQQVDKEELAVVMRLVKQNLEAQMRSPGYEYSNRVKLINYGDCYYWRPTEVKDLDQVDLHLACAFHNINFRNPGEFTMVISGNITLEQVTLLISQYLASIPATPLPPGKLAADVTELPFTYPSEPIIEDVAVEMVNEIASQQITIPVVLNRPEARVLLVWLSLAVRIIETRLMQRMRFEFGDVYTVQVSSFFGCDAPSNQGDIRGDVAITFTCDPMNRDRLAELALTELDHILSDPSFRKPGLVPISQEELDTAALLESLSYKESEGELSHWHSLIYQSYQSKSLPELGSIEAVYDKNIEARNLVLKTSLTPQAMFDALRDIFPPPRSRYTVVRMVPKRPRTSYLLPAICTGLVICGISAFFLARGCHKFRG